MQPGARAQQAPKAPCRLFAAGNCTYGDRCRFSHDPAVQAAAQAAAQQVAAADAGNAAAVAAAAAYQGAKTGKDGKKGGGKGQDDKGGKGSTQHCSWWLAWGSCNRGTNCPWVHDPAMAGRGIHGAGNGK